MIVSNAGASRGYVLCPFLYTLYTNECRSVDLSTLFVRFSDDTVMLALLSDFASYQSYLSSVVRFSSWCNFLYLNISTMKTMCFDFRCNRSIVSPIVISDEPVEQVDLFKYLDVLFCSLQGMSQPCNGSLSSVCTFFESCELSTLTYRFFYVSVVTSLSLS